MILIVDPIYPGCEVNMKNQQLRNCFQKKIQTHINKNFRYPKIAQRRKIEGRVFVQFIIGTEGYIDQIRKTLSLRLRQKMNSFVDSQKYLAQLMEKLTLFLYLTFRLGK